MQSVYTNTDLGSSTVDDGAVSDPARRRERAAALRVGGWRQTSEHLMFKLCREGRGSISVKLGFYCSKASTQRIGRPEKLGCTYQADNAAGIWSSGPKGPSRILLSGILRRGSGMPLDPAGYIAHARRQDRPGRYRALLYVRLDQRIAQHHQSEEGVPSIYRSPHTRWISKGKLRGRPLGTAGLRICRGRGPVRSSSSIT